MCQRSTDIRYSLVYLLVIHKHYQRSYWEMKSFNRGGWDTGLNLYIKVKEEHLSSMCGLSVLMSVLPSVCVKNNDSNLFPVVVKFQTLNLYLFFLFFFPEWSR